jgi:Bacterial extracellular solute-binding protein
MGASVPSQVTWMNGVIQQFHKQFPAYAKTRVVTSWIPWGNRTTDWTNALTSGKGAPDITELGNTDTPGIASQGALADVTSNVKSWSHSSDLIAGNLANDTVSGQNFAVPWFGGVRGVWYRKDQFAAAGITAPPTTWAQLVADAKLLMKKYPGTYGIGAPSNFTNAIVSFIWGAGGQVAVQQGGKWVAELNTPQSEAGIKFYSDLLLSQHVSPARYIGQTELGAPGATSGGSNEDFAKGTLDMYIDGPWGLGLARGGQQEVRLPVGLIPDPQPKRTEPGSGLLRWLRPRRLGQEPEQGGRLGPGHGDGQPVQRDHLRQLAGLLPGVHLAAVQRRVLQQPGHGRIRQGRRRHPDLATELQELGHGRRHRSDRPEHDEVADAGRQPHCDGEQGQHRPAECAEHRPAILTG